MEVTEALFYSRLLDLTVNTVCVKHFLVMSVWFMSLQHLNCISETVFTYSLTLTCCKNISHFTRFFLSFYHGKERQKYIFLIYLWRCFCGIDLFVCCVICFCFVTNLKHGETNGIRNLNIKWNKIFKTEKETFILINFFSNVIED
jgi:hypothetical protein